MEPTCPSVGLTSPLNNRKRLVFPTPDGPVMATKDELGTEKLSF